MPLTKVATPGKETIQAVAEYLGVPTSQTLKAVFYRADDETLLVTIRGDLEVNEVKLKNLLRAKVLRMATAEESRAVGLTPGYTSPVGLTGVRCIADDSVQLGSIFVVGANEPGYHYTNANYPRDFSVDLMGEIALAEAGHGCPQCGTPLKAVRGIEVGHVFKLGTFFSETLGAAFLDAEGRQHPLIMGCYGIGVGRLLGAAIEQNHDEKGIIFPPAIAPYQVHLAALNVTDSMVLEPAERLYQSLTELGYEVLFDDRDESAGVKLNDADLLGLPVRLVVSPRNVKRGVLEAKRRRETAAVLLPMEEAASGVARMLQ